MRVPGIGIQSAGKICAARKFSTLTWEHLKKLGVALERARYFIVCGKDYERADMMPGQIRQRILSLGTSKYKPNFSPQLKIF
jgi:predicted DNA-binding helix-hairpin-helix protein